MNEEALKNRLRDQADQCVKCGLCLPHCPTYGARLNEGDSPRGRIALIQGLTEGRLEPSARLDAHLAGCLECRACETVCPSLVPFGSIMDGARALRTLSSPSWQRLLRRVSLDALSAAPAARAASLLAQVYRGSGLGRLAQWIGIERWPLPQAYHRLALQLRRPAKLRAAHRRESDQPPDLYLFPGCVARTIQPEALEAALRVLERLGFRVSLPAHPACCGAMHRHNGFPRQADRLLGRNASAFGDRLAIGIASACVAELRTHPRLEGTQEICRFLADLQWPDEVRLRPLAARVAVHEPCSHRNQLRDGRAAYDLLRRIPDIETVPLPGNASCCGAAGTYLLQQPMMSQVLLQPKISDLKRLGAKILVTTNTGCALHLAAGVREAGLDLEVLHPVELVARQLAD